MKLLRYGEPGHERPGLADAAGRIRDLGGEITDLAPETLDEATLNRLKALDPDALPLVEGNPRIGSCVARPGKFLCIGLNYSEHAAEQDIEPPAEPVLFMKAVSALSGPDDPIIIPRGSTKTDWEIELGVVIGRHAKYVDEAEALEYVAGYCTINDLSEREFQLESTGQWVKGKSCDSFGPIGPWLVTRDEIPDPQNLPMWLEVNGHRFQDGNTRTMIFGVAALVSYISRFMSLQPGDVISTGTPSGVGLAQRPPVYLKAGDRVALEIEGLGQQNQLCVPDD
jgi:2-keto-4-pentenoate hydratase/2-oxohepta-3-ene-1,7-dioic acid hydratase in catechol pathway